MNALLKPVRAPAQDYVAEWTSVDALARRKDSWRALAERAAEPNPFYGPEYLLSCARDIDRNDIRCMAVYRSADTESDLVGLFPVMRGRLTRGAVMPTLELYQNDYICSTAPLLDRDDPVGIFGRFLDLFEGEIARPRTAIARALPSARPAAQALRLALAERKYPIDVVDRYERAAVETERPLDSYLTQISANRRKDLRRRQRRLEEKGAVSFRTLDHRSPDLRAGLEDFLRVEASGWKKQSGTAMDCQPGTRRLAENAFVGPDSEIDLMAVDGRAVAVCASIVTQGVKYTVKTAFDEDFRASSPSVLLDQYMLDQFTRGGRLSRADSCALPGQLVESMWREKEPIESVVFAIHPSTSSARVRSLSATLRSFDRLKSWMKQQIPKE